MTQRQQFRESVERDSEQQRQAEQQNPGLFGMLWYGGVLGLLLAIPMVGGAYLGRWLDSLNPEFGTRWTVSLIVLGVAVGVWNVIWYIREHT